ncbi:Rho-GTPase-activating protein LRG1 [Astathelohania contejeani]|uniref:Rho-GTPase-activating protein LRG1 n=1 Tax=Astathelohania contejeani TaxID=164912 RepID=A0ABQ7HZ60_9MICR|nr:Rho-GTPase-activating protein LRG1 [Thelohania contejeani]
MNDKFINSMLIPNIRSINDLNEEQLAEYRQSFFKKHGELLSKTYRYLERKRVAQDSLFFNLFLGIPEIQRCGMVLYPSDIKFGNNLLYIPLEFECLMKCVLKKDLRVSGLFRKPPVYTSTQKCVDEFINRLQETNDTSRLVEILDKYEVLALTSVFKILFEWYGETIFPQCFLQMYVRITNMENEADVLILVRSLVMGLPRNNRHLLEALLKFIVMVHRISTDGGVDHDSKMNIKGFSVVMMPNFFLKPGSKVELSDVGQLVKLSEFILNHSSEIFKVED